LVRITAGALGQYERRRREVDGDERVEAAPLGTLPGAACRGSSGTGNGMRSMTARTHAAPGGVDAGPNSAVVPIEHRTSRPR